jgi:hypothetical protein
MPARVVSYTRSQRTLLPYQTGSTDAKEAARLELAEKQRSRLYAEQRKRNDRRELSEATKGQ